MVSNNNDFVDEGELYEKIINLFLKEGESANLKEVKKSKSIIDLMNGLKNNKDRDLARNALIVLLSLYDDYSPDMFTNLGSDIKDLSEKDKEDALTILKDIFIK